MNFLSDRGHDFFTFDVIVDDVRHELPRGLRERRNRNGGKRSSKIQERDEVIAAVSGIVQESGFQDGDMRVRKKLKPYLVKSRCRAIGVDVGESLKFGMTEPEGVDGPQTEQGGCNAGFAEDIVAT